MGFNVDYIKIFFFIIKILVFLAVVSLIIIAILKEKKKQESQTGNSESHLLRKILFITIIIFGCIAIIPSPLVLMASSMSAGGGSIHWSDPLELLIRFLWILTIFYPVYIALPFFLGRELIIKKNKKIGYVLVIFSGLLSIGLIIFFISMFV